MCSGSPDLNMFQLFAKCKISLIRRKVRSVDFEILEFAGVVFFGLFCGSKAGHGLERCSL